jgi:hypothetical protein
MIQNPQVPLIGAELDGLIVGGIRMTDDRSGVGSPLCNGLSEFPHAQALGAQLGAQLAACSKLPSIGTWYVGEDDTGTLPLIRYRATYARGVHSVNGFGLSAPICAELEATIYARDDIDAERCAESIARDRVDYLIACSRVS